MSTANIDTADSLAPTAYPVSGGPQRAQLHTRSSVARASAPLGIADLIRESQEHPAQPIVMDLLHEHEIAGLHGSPESFKTVFALQLAEAIATGQPFLGVWPIAQPKTVLFFETEMSVQALGKRLSKMFRGQNIPERVKFASATELRRFKRAPHLAAKFEVLQKIAIDAEAEVVIIDTCNPFFRGNQSPSDETTVGQFFDHVEALPAATRLFVRHNHKPRIDDFGNGDGTARIRGSGQFADVPDLLLEIRREDKRTNEATLEVTKYRHGSKPEIMKLWFDGGDLRLIAVSPVIHLLKAGPLSRGELLRALEARFGVNQRKGDDLITEQRPFLRDFQRGHERMFEINREAAMTADWFPRIQDATV